MVVMGYQANLVDVVLLERLEKQEVLERRETGFVSSKDSTCIIAMLLVPTVLQGVPGPIGKPGPAGPVGQPVS